MTFPSRESSDGGCSSSSSRESSPPKRPRLSLQINAISSSSSGRMSRALAAAVNPKSPTASNTLSNVYVTAMDRPSTPIQEPVTAINTCRPSLKLQTRGISQSRGVSLPDTPATAQPTSPASAIRVQFPSIMTSTPPLSPGSLATSNHGLRAALLASASLSRPLPYTHSEHLHSILRNSPLPLATRSHLSPPQRASQRSTDGCTKKVAYNSPLEQTITNHQFTKSHIDLLNEELLPSSSTNGADDDIKDALTYGGVPLTADEIGDGGHTPSPFETMRHHMAAIAPTPVAKVSWANGVFTRRREKMRRWVWTIGVDDEYADEIETPIACPLQAALPAPSHRCAIRSDLSENKDIKSTTTTTTATSDPQTLFSWSSPTNYTEPPTPSVDSIMSNDSVFDAHGDVDMSDISSIGPDDDDENQSVQDKDEEEERVPEPEFSTSRETTPPCPSQTARLWTFDDCDADGLRHKKRSTLCAVGHGGFLK